MVVQTPPLPGPKSRMRKEEGWSMLYKTCFERTFDLMSKKSFPVAVFRLRSDCVLYLD